MNKKLIKQSIFATIFSAITIGVLTILTYKTDIKKQEDNNS